MTTVRLRTALPSDAAACVRMRGMTRENAVSPERLAAVGITSESWGADIASGCLPGQVCEDGAELVGYCFGDVRTGEVVVLALLPAYERLGLGKELLRRVMESLRSVGHARLFLGCARDPATRSHGFYRHLGWLPTGTVDSNDDEILEFHFGGVPPPGD